MDSEDLLRIIVETKQDLQAWIKYVESSI